MKSFYYKHIFPIIKSYQWYRNVFKHDYDYDYAGVYKVIGYKLARVRNVLENDTFVVQNKKDMQALRIAIKVADKLHKENYAERTRKKHDDKWGPLDIDFDAPGFKATRRFVISAQDKKQEKQERMALYKLEESLIQRDKNILFSILNKYMNRWWS